jgi:hypothetical protein
MDNRRVMMLEDEAGARAKLLASLGRESGIRGLDAFPWVCESFKEYECILVSRVGAGATNESSANSKAQTKKKASVSFVGPDGFCCASRSIVNDSYRQNVEPELHCNAYSSDLQFMLSSKTQTKSNKTPK